MTDAASLSPARHADPYSGVGGGELRLFTSESVTAGHPDKICDQISDAILDAILAADPSAKVAVETLTTTGLVQVAGEVNTSAYVEIPRIVRETILDIGYDSSANGFDGAQCGVNISIGQQSSDIFAGVSRSLEAREYGSADEVDEQGAGDQGIMFGYATDETPAYMPMPIYLAHRLSERLTAVRRAENTPMPYLLPDGKTQVTIGYAPGHVPTTVEAVVVSTQHHEWVTQEQLRADVEEHVIRPVIERSGLDTSGMRIIINPGGKFVIGGPVGDAGLTGRKIIVDTYGGMARHGGGAFSGKDPSKVDRSAAYMLRWVAKNVVAAGLASRADVTFFDEPYMGLDAVARQLFYDRLLKDYAEHPRTIVLSSHLIDEVAHLIENVVLIDGGRILLDEPVEDLRDRAVTLVGRSDAVDEIVAGREILHHESMGRMVRTTVLGALDGGERRRVEQLEVDVVPVSLQQLVVRLTAREQKETGR